MEESSRALRGASVRARVHYGLAVAVLVVYGGKVCPFMDGLGPWPLALLVGVPLGLAYGLRRAGLGLVGRVSAMRRPVAQFRLDLGLFLLAGAASGVFGHLVLGFPWGSGVKLLVGSLALGVFAAVDLALECERGVIREAMARPRAFMRPLARLSPMTRRFFVITVCVIALATGVMALMLLADADWLMSQPDPSVMERMLVRSVLLDLFTVMGLLTGHILNLVHSYSRNLKLLFANQTGALEHVSRGDLDTVVPVATQDEFGLIAGHTNAMIEGLRDRMRMVEGLRVAREVQQRLLPRRAPAAAGLDLAGSTRYSDETGGDYYDFLEDPQGGRLGVAVGDVTGHGVGAAMLMTSVRGLLRLRAAHPGGLGERLGDVNRMLIRDTFGSGRFMTLFLLEVDLADRSLAWGCAGHDPGMLYDPATGEFTDLDGGDVPLGVTPQAEYREFSRGPLAPGSVLVLGTDGIWEARDASGRMFGKDRVREVVRAHAASPAGDIAAAVTAAVDAFAAGTPQADDQTLVVLKVPGSQA